MVLMVSSKGLSTERRSLLGRRLLLFLGEGRSRSSRASDGDLALKLDTEVIVGQESEKDPAFPEGNNEVPSPPEGAGGGGGGAS